jgi:N-acetylmuramoyl-L-alanine amidase
VSLGPIKYLTIHCAATPEGRDVRPETVEQWDIAKFGQKSYHWIVDIHGNQHRSLEDDQLGCHTGLHNHGNIGVCYVGGCDAHMAGAKDTRTDAQKAALVDLVQHYKTLYPGIIVRGHRDWPNVRKDCPSFDVAAWLRSEML